MSHSGIGGMGMGWSFVTLSDVELAPLPGIMGRTFHVLVLSLTHSLLPPSLNAGRLVIAVQTPQNGASLLSRPHSSIFHLHPMSSKCSTEVRNKGGVW